MSLIVTKGYGLRNLIVMKGYGLVAVIGIFQIGDVIVEVESLYYPFLSLIGSIDICKLIEVWKVEDSEITQVYDLQLSSILDVVLPIIYKPAQVEGLLSSVIEVIRDVVSSGIRSIHDINIFIDSSKGINSSEIIYSQFHNLGISQIDSLEFIPEIIEAEDIRRTV